MSGPTFDSMAAELVAWQTTCNGYRRALDTAEADLALARRELSRVIRDAAAIREDERRTAAAYLRDQAARCAGGGLSAPGELHDAADDIERGAHRPKVDR